MSEYPSHWINCQLGERIHFEYGKSPNEVRCSDGKYPVYGSSGKTALAINYTTESPAIIVGRKGTIDKPIFLQERCWAIDTTFFTDKFPSDDPKYLFYLLDSINLRSLNESTGVPSLSRDALHSIPVSLPPLPEQKKIAEILSGIDQELDRCNACLSRTNLLRTSLLKSMVKDAEEHSINHPLGNIVEVINGRAYKLTEWENEGTPVIRLQNLTKQGGSFYYSNLRLPEKQYCNNGDLLFMWSASFGPHIWWGDKAIYHYHIWKMVPRGDSILKNYLYLYLQYKTEEWKSQGSGMAMIHLTKEGIEKEVVPLPSVTAQEKVVYTMKSIDERITGLKKKAGKYSLLKNAMSSDLLSGRKRVRI